MKIEDKLLLAESIGKVIATRRRERGMTQEYVAECLGVGCQAVSRIERGAIMPTIRRLIQLAGVFDCPVEELVVDASNRTTDQGAVLSRMIEGLTEADRAFLLGVIEQIAGKLKEKSPGASKRSRRA